MTLKKYFSLVLPFILFFLFWELISRSGIVAISLFPPPSLVFSALVMLFKHGFLADIMISMARLSIGLLLGSAVGLIIGLCTGRIRMCNISLAPLLNIFRAFPPVALIPLIIVWFGIGEPAKIISIAVGVFFPVWLNTHIGAEHVPVHYVRAGSLLTRSHITLLKKVIFPATLPFTIAGIRTSIALGFIMIYVSELAGASQGIGYYISIAHLNYAIDTMVAALFVLGILAALVDYVFTTCMHHFLPWTKTS